MQVTPIPCLTDNYAYIINDNNFKIVGVVDPSEASPVIDFLQQQNLRLDYILNTHHHFDHIGGNIELKKNITLRLLVLMVINIEFRISILRSMIKTNGFLETRK
jgi:glyoxylase-like metal-dependent hydrolase (beta-lactamase superfamily II)